MLTHQQESATKAGKALNTTSRVGYGLLSAAALLLFTNNAYAAENSGPKWTIMDVQYQHADFDDNYLSGKGLVVRSFVQFKEHGLFYVSGGAANITDNFGSIGFEYTATNFNLGIGGRYPVAETTDIFAVAGPSFVHYDFGGRETETDTGFIAVGGVRAAVGDKFDVSVFVDYTNFDGFDDTSINFEGRYWFNDRFALTTGFSPDSDVNIFSVGFSVAF